ncbi:hypothetical protein chiPu_0013473 [Chiloscyllium punctatum]|uniref:Uncharacterized protein n=1 Tax=Chiloscyllium punctatum TaxID=137246 RepID=A0A401SX75_CHIPU|nr:hypothetical protein [Chiloscyllium punctatum]
MAASMGLVVRGGGDYHTDGPTYGPEAATAVFKMAVMAGRPLLSAVNWDIGLQLRQALIGEIVSAVVVGLVWYTGTQEW